MSDQMAGPVCVEGVAGVCPIANSSCPQIWRMHHDGLARQATIRRLTVLADDALSDGVRQPHPGAEEALL